MTKLQHEVKCRHLASAVQSNNVDTAVGEYHQPWPVQHGRDSRQKCPESDRLMVDAWFFSYLPSALLILTLDEEVYVPSFQHRRRKHERQTLHADTKYGRNRALVLYLYSVRGSQSHQKRQNQHVPYLSARTTHVPMLPPCFGVSRTASVPKHDWGKNAFSTGIFMLVRPLLMCNRNISKTVWNFSVILCRIRRFRQKHILDEPGPLFTCPKPSFLSELSPVQSRVIIRSTIDIRAKL